MILNARRYRQAAEQAAKDTASFLTLTLQSSAANSGWGSLSSAVAVSYDREGYKVRTQSEALDQVKALEYGTPDTQPSAVIRKFANRTDEAEKFFVGRMKQVLRSVR